MFSPIGIHQVEQFGQSLVFLIESNPGPGLGVLLAYMVFGKGGTKQTAGGASIIHFFGGIQEIYFPYVLMKPRLILALIAGGMAGVSTLVLFDAGLVSAASPGSIFAILVMAPKSSMLGVALSILISTVVSFLCSSFILKTDQKDEVEQGRRLSDWPTSFFESNIKLMIVTQQDFYNDRPRSPWALRLI